MNNIKQNDWIVANINNPEFTESDFKNIQGLTLDNTQLLPFESYLNSKFIIENDNFKGNDGLFDKDKFKEFYKNQASKFGEFQKNSALDNYEYGFWDIYQKPDSRIKNPNFNLDTTSNPDHVSTGVIGPNMQGEKTKTPFELAEKQKIFNWEEGKYEDLTPESSALFSNPIRFVQNLFSDPLVLAEYEQDEIDPITGEQHYKGDKKLNDKGEYYFETLGGRSIVGKKILSLGDILTKEDSLINKYDFFDSDDFEKSTTGVIAKNLASIAPIVLLGPTGTAWYSGFYVAREISKSLPMLNNILQMWNDDNEDPKLLNTIAGLGEKFTGGTSEKAKSSTFSFENFGNLVADVALQWSQQKLIANSIAKIKGNTNAIVDAAETKAALEYEKRAQEIWNRANNGEQIAALRYTNATSFDDIANAISSGRWKASSVGTAAMQKFIPEAEKAFSKQAQLGQDLSLIYMSMISNYDVYNDAIEHGTTKNEAAAVALGSMLGMFAVDKYAHLGEIFFDETPEKMALRNLRQGIRDEASELSKRIGTQTTKDTTKKGLMNIIKRSADKASNFIKNYESGLKNHTLGFFGKAFGEGLEETAEELNTDLWKSLYQLAGQFGYVSQTDIGAWDNAFDRYAMSFLGGAVGGGLFYGIDNIKNPKSASDRNTQKELLYLVSQGKTKDILDNLDEMREKGQLASKDLSIDTTDDENGNKVFLTADENHKSQNDYVYGIMKNSILQMESILNEHGLKLSDDQLFEKMVLSNQRYMTLKNSLFDKSYITQYYDDFQQIVSDIYNIEKQIQDLKSNTKDENKREENSDYQQKLENLEEQKKELIKQKESFLKGEYNLDYVDKMLFYIHPEISGMFYSTLYEQWVQEKYHKDVSELSESEKKKYSKEWQDLKKTKGKQYLNEAFNLYKKTRSDLEKGLKEISSDDPLKWGELLKQLKETSPENQGLKWDDIIPSKQVDIDSFLDSLAVVKTAEYDKPWRNDSSKTNKAFQLQLAEDSTAGFEIVKDHEDGYWSIHFKTPRTLTIEQKQRLFQAAAAVIPEGDKLSTHGELTKGGISGINRFGQLDFLGGIEFEQVGTRQLKTKGTRPKNDKYISFDELGDLDFDKYYYFVHQTLSSNAESIFENGLRTSAPGLTGTALQIGSKEGLQSYVESIKDGSQRHRGSEGFVLIKVDKSKLSNANNPYEDIVDLLSDPTVVDPEFIQNYVEVIPTTMKEQDIEVPIWQKTVTGETEEDYRDRNTQREGESEEAFKARKQARENKRLQYNQENFIKSVKKFLSVNDVIDRGTFRQLIAQLGARRSDVLDFVIKQAKSKSTGLVTAQNKKEFNTTLKESLSKLHPDLSNREEVAQEILSKTRKLRKREFDNKNSHRKVVLEETRLPDDLFDIDTLLDQETISFDDIIEALNLKWQGQKISISSNLTPEQRVEYPVTFEEVKDNFYIMQNGENSVLFNRALENAIKIHNMELDSTVDHSDEIEAIKSEMDEQNYVKLNSDGIETIEPYLFLVDNGRYDDEKDETIAIQDSQQEQELNNLIDEIGSNEDLQVMNELHKKATIDLNPVIKILRAVLPSLGEDFGDIEKTLESVYQQFESLEVPTSFALSQKQLDALNKAYKYFDYIKAVIRAAKTKSSYFDYLPYNNSLNEFIRQNKDVIKNVEELLEMDEDLANVIEESFEHFDKEISAWIKRGQNGVVNKREMFSKFDQRFNKARLDFFNQIKDSCKLDAEKNLFKGIEHIDIEKPDAIVEIEKLIYNNFKQQSWTEQDFVSIIQKLVVPKNVIKQDSGLNKSLDSDFVFTDYDKFILLTSLVASDPIDFYEFYKGYVQNSKGKDGQKLAPLTFQEYNIKLGFVHKNNKEFINTVLEEFAKQNNIKTNILKNALIISGIAGVGKTDVVVRALQESDSVWVSGPSDTQIDGLKKIIPHAQTFGHTELFNSILGSDQYSQILSEIKEGTNKAKNEDKAKDGKLYSGKYITVKKGSDYPELIEGSIKFITKDAPKQLVIDEVTLFSNTELLLLSKWADLTGCELIFAGDKHQNGDDSIGFNIKEDCVFAFRTPEMKISLRDSNIWKYKNQQDIVQQLDELEKYGSGKENIERTKKYLNNFNFHYYLNNDKSTGELITESLDDNVVKLLNGKIAFVGNTSSQAYQKLKGTGKDIEVFDSIEKIQGKEFDYVISDIDLEYKPEEGYSEYYNIMRYLNTLYTLITRSKNGTILIDNGLTKTIKGSVSEQYSNDNIGITPEITEQYVQDKINFLNSLNLTREVPLEPKEEPLTEETVIEGEEFEEDEPETEEEEPETEDDSYLDVEAQQEAIVPIYGNINFSGLIRDSSTGKLHKGGDNRDLGIFLSDEDQIEVKDRPLRSLFQLKSLILFDKLKDDYWYNKAGHQVTDLFSLEDLQNIKYYVQAEDYNSETHRLLTKEAGYKEGEQQFSINGVKKVFTLIGVIEKNGKEYQITLGGLSNPKTLLDNANDKEIKGKTIKGTITRIQERAEKVSDPELKQKLLDYAKHYLDRVADYESQLKDLISNSKWKIGEGKSRWRIKKPALDRCTRISKLKNEDGTPRYVPLNDYFDTNTSQYVVSPIYTQINENGKESLFPGLDDKHKGKPVIFVSAFGLYDPSQLQEIYETQKKDPDNNYPEVRKIILDPRGVDFEELVNIDVDVEDKDKIKFPFSNTATAFRMYMSLWNFRAKITKFNSLVKTYLDEHGITPAQIEQLAIEEAQNPGSTDEKFKPLRDLNEYLKENNVEQFRLGYNATNGLYSRKIDDKTDGTYINYQMAIDYQKVIDLLFENVLNKLITPPSATTVKSIMSKTSDFDKQEKAIDTWVRKLGSHRAVSINLKSDTNNEVVNFEVKNVELFRSLPLTLVKICKNIQLGQRWSQGFKNFRQTLQDDTSLQSWWYVKIRDTRTNEDEYLDYLSIVDGLSGGILDTAQTGTHIQSPGIRAYNEETGEGNYDRRIINLFKLAFHGHVGDGAPADGLLLKYGIFADTFVIGKYVAGEPFKFVTTDRGLYRTNAIPSSPVVKANITPWDGTTEEQSEEKEKEVENTELTRVNKVLGTKLSKLDDIPVIIQNNVNNIFSSVVGSKKLLNTIVEYQELNGIYTFKTVKDIIKEQTGLDVTKLDNSSSDSGVEYEFSDLEGNKYFLIKNGDKLEIKDPDKEVVTKDNLESFVKDLKEVLSGGLSEQIIQDLEENDIDTDKFGKFTTDLFLEGLELSDFKNVFNNFVNYVKNNITDVDISELSKLQNRLNKIPC